MKVFKSIGSKDRLFEMMENVNKTKKLNEDFDTRQIGVLDSGKVLEIGFHKLLSDKLKVDEVNTQTNGNETSVELVCFDNTQNTIVFRFTGVANESATDNVFTFNDAKMVGFSFDSADGSNSVELDEGGLQQFNAQHQKEILDVVTNYADVESGVEEPSFGLEEAIKVIDAIKMDSMPYGGEFDTMQSGENYVDKKPVNDKIRVDAPELDKFVKEAEDFLKMFPDDMEKVDKQIMLNKRLEGTAEFFDTLPTNERQELLNQGVAKLIQDMQMHPQLILNKIGFQKFKELAWKKIEPVVNDLRLSALNEKWGKDVKIKKTGEHANKTIDQLQKELDALKGKEPYDREKAGELSFAIRAKRDWKGGVDEGDYPEKMPKDISPQTSYPKKRKKHPSKLKVKTTSKKPTTISEYKYPDNAESYAKLLDTAEKQGIITKHERVAEYISQAAKEIATKFDEEVPNPRIKLSLFNIYYGMFLDKIGKKVNEEFDDDEAAKMQAFKDMEDNMEMEPAPEDMYGDVGVSHGEKEPYSRMLELAGLSKGDFGLNMSEKEEETEEPASEPVGDQIEGGLADDEDASSFDPKQIMKGMEVEMEHTDDPKIALEIALDHLMEIPDYYTRLDSMEKEAGVEDGEGDESDVETQAMGALPPVSVNPNLDPNAPEDLKNNDEETEDELLGFKPHNVGDYTGEEEVSEEIGFEEYEGNIGDRYADAEGNEFSVRDKVKGGVTLKGQSGEKEIATRDLQFMKKLEERTDDFETPLEPGEEPQECPWCGEESNPKDWYIDVDGYERCPFCGGNE